jgi:cytochrome P450
MSPSNDARTDEFVFETYDEIREGLYHRDLTRKYDDRSFEEGNPRADILSMLHGSEHRERRRMENPLFRRNALIQYERDLFPEVLNNVLATQQHGPVDLFRLAGALSVVLAARRAGIDHDGTMEQLGELWDHVLMIAQASAILDQVGDKDKILSEVSEALVEFGREFVGPSQRRREQLLDAYEADGEPEPPDDLITTALGYRRDGRLELDDGIIIREAGLYLHGGSHTSAQTTCNTFYYLLGFDGRNEPHPVLERIAADPSWAQRAVHETLRLRPTTPRLQRRAVRDLTLGGVEIPAGSRVVFDVRTANRDPQRYGDDPEVFNPDRQLAEGTALWGLSFGAGSHICIGRSVAGGFPLQQRELRDGVGGEQHLYGLVALIVRAIAACGVSSIADDPPELDTRTDRGTRWARFPIQVDRTPATVALVTGE